MANQKRKGSNDFLTPQPTSDDDYAVEKGSTEEGDSDIRVSQPPRKVRKVVSHVQVDGHAFPRTTYQGYEPPLSPCDENKAISHLKAAFDRHCREVGEQLDFTYFTLDDFSIYTTKRSGHANELVPLDRLNNRDGYDELVFDGVVSFGTEKRYLKGVRFSILTVEGYGDPTVVSLDNRICVQSRMAQRHDIWYQLGRPSCEYDRFYEPFLWLVGFTKYFIDYLLSSRNVQVPHFRKHFYRWLKTNHKGPAFESWHRQCGHMRDFRTTVAANVGFLWKESYDIDDEDGLCQHEIWHEVDPKRLKGLPAQPNNELFTVCTPFVYECFKMMYFGQMLVSRTSSEAVSRLTQARKDALGLTPLASTTAPSLALLSPLDQEVVEEITEAVNVKVGDVVTVLPDESGPWKLHVAVWYAYVQGVRREQKRSTTGTVLDVIWLYEPHDTTLGKAYYPFRNELFMSDNCGCGKDAIDLSCVTGKVDVAWFVSDPYSVSGCKYFVRQQFRTKDEEDYYDFVTLTNDHFVCGCTQKVSDFEECRRQFFIGDTVLARVQHPTDATLGDVLEPAQIIDFDLDRRRVVLREMQLRRSFEPAARPNELMLTDHTYDVAARNVVRKCHVRYFSEKFLEEEGLPVPYDHNGVGDFYFIIGNESAITLDSAPDASEAAGELCKLPLEQGPDIAGPAPFEKLRGMGIFCGGGNFDRGLEEGGAVEFSYAVDYAERAIYSYRANAAPDVKCFYGSVNDYLARAMAGSSAAAIATVGDIDFISGGSPCPGFSRMQQNRVSAESLRNASLVASFVSFVDFYVPEYCLLENVASMTDNLGAKKDENVFSQILAALVAMGYQVQQFLMESWSYGSPQSRTRVFIAASAPGLEPWPAPPHTHAHPNTRFIGKSVGRSSNGLTFGKRRDDDTPFKHVSIGEATEDLPDIADAQVQLCPSHPDHRVPMELDANKRSVIAMIPKRPHGMGLVLAARMGLLSGAPLDYYNHSRKDVLKAKGPPAKTFSRIKPDGLCQTVTTALKLSCVYSGRTLHWTQDRPLTVLELRRAQGFPDEEVILGTPAQQVVIIGNSVDRNVALALGLALRESCLKSHKRPSEELVEEVRAVDNADDEIRVGAPPADDDVSTRDTEEDSGIDNQDEDLHQAGSSAVRRKARVEVEVEAEAVTKTILSYQQQRVRAGQGVQVSAGAEDTNCSVQ